MAALLLFGLLFMGIAAGWKRWFPAKSPRGWTPLYLELLGLGMIIAGLWRFPAARWVGLVAGVALVLGAGLKAWRANQSAG